jgi:hypothetical protein
LYKFGELVIKNKKKQHNVEKKLYAQKDNFPNKKIFLTMIKHIGSSSKTLSTIVSTSKRLLSSIYKDAFHCFDKSFHAICL